MRIIVLDEDVFRVGYEEKNDLVVRLDSCDRPTNQYNCMHACAALRNT